MRIILRRNFSCGNSTCEYNLHATNDYGGTLVLTHVITSLCLRDNGCASVCPVDCIHPGEPHTQWPTFFIDPSACIDCGACVSECPHHAIFPLRRMPYAYKARGGEVINQAGLTGYYEGSNHLGETIILKTTRTLSAGEIIDLSAILKEVVVWSFGFLKT